MQDPEASATDSAIFAASCRYLAVEKLMEMGFARRRAVKAVTNTGCFKEKDAGHCVTWLLAHADDPMIDVPQPRQYIMYLCPEHGPLCNDLENFWKQSEELCGRNGVHDSFPHIRLCTFFLLQDDSVFDLLDVTEEACRELMQSGLLSSSAERDTHAAPSLAPAPTTLELEYRRVDEPLFLGLFLSDHHNAALHAFVQQLASSLAATDIMMEPYSKKLHVTLAYRFGRQHMAELDGLANGLNLSAPCNWSLRLYSRDPRAEGSQLRQVVHSYDPQAPDELELTVGDIILTDVDSVANSIDGWYKGTSHCTGRVGMYPSNYTEKTLKEHATWTLVSKLRLVDHRGQASAAVERPEVHRRPVPAPPRTQASEVPKVAPQNDQSNLISQSVSAAAAVSESEHTIDPGDCPMLLFLRHGERIDAVMGKDWVKTCFESRGSSYVMKRYNLNMPDRMLRRKQVSHFELDGPITEIGRLQARLTGQAIARCPNLYVEAIYSSPALRCIETAEEIVKVLPHPLDIRVEKGLFEWMGWYRNKSDIVFMTPSDLRDQGYHIDLGYSSYQTMLDPAESLKAYYDRSHRLATSILESHKGGLSSLSDGGGSPCVLLVSHAATPEVCTRRLMHGKPRDQLSFLDIINRMPYCATVLFGCAGKAGAGRVEDDGRGDNDPDGIASLASEHAPAKAKWQFHKSPIPALSHRDNKALDLDIFSS